MYKIYFDYSTESESRLPALWYINACEIIIILKTLEVTLSEVALVKQIPKIVLEQKFVDVDLNGLDALGAFSKIYMYLADVVFENLLKCVILHQDPDRLNEITKGHNLTKLFELANIDMSNEDKEFIRRLEIYVIWAGRYPHPKVKSNKGHEKGRIEFRFYSPKEGWINRVNNTYA